MYKLVWTLQVVTKDEEHEDEQLGTYSGNVDFDSIKLLQKACILAGEQMFVATVKDNNVV